MRRFPVLFLFLVLGFTSLHAENYYISNDGQDANKGTHPAQAWRSLDKLNNSMDLFLPGDSVLFRRGDVFRGTLHITCAGAVDYPIMFAGFGSGADPVIDGSISVSEWVADTGNIWRASLPGSYTGEVKNLFIDQEMAPLGRHPNTGYFYTSDPIGKTGFSSSDMGTFPPNYWAGADVVMRTANWILDVLPIASVDGNKVVLGEDATYDLLSGFGFFLQNHLNTLDRDGEWAWTANGSIYLRAVGFDPNLHDVSITGVSTGLLIEHASFVDVQGLIIAYHKEVGVMISSSDHIMLRRSEIRFCGMDALQANFSDRVLLEDNLFTGAHNNGVVFKNTANSEIRENRIRSIGSVAGRGLNGNLKYMGVLIDRSDDLLFQHNIVDSIGYNGISFFRSANIKIRDNAVRYTCLVKDDGGGIYTWENQKPGNEVTGNIVTFTMGEQAGVPASKKHKAHGIYIDDRSWDLLVEDNTSAYNHDYGIYIHNVRDVGIHRNTLVDNDVQLGFSGGEDWPGNKASDNTFICTADNMLCVRIYGTYNYEQNFPEFNNNLYGKFVEHKIAYRSYDNFSANYFFDQWMETSGDEEMRGWPVPYDDSVARGDFLFFACNMEQQGLKLYPEGRWISLEDSLVNDSILVPPFSSLVLVRDTRPVTVEHMVQRLPDSLLQIYPNPSSGQVTVKLDNPYLIEELRMFNAYGCRVDTDPVRGFINNTFELDMSGSSPGIYIISVRTNRQVLYGNLVVK